MASKNNFVICWTRLNNKFNHDNTSWINHYSKDKIPQMYKFARSNKHYLFALAKSDADEILDQMAKDGHQIYKYDKYNYDIIGDVSDYRVKTHNFYEPMYYLEKNINYNTSGISPLFIN